MHVETESDLLEMNGIALDFVPLQQLTKIPVHLLNSKCGFVV